MPHPWGQKQTITRDQHMHSLIFKLLIKQWDEKTSLFLVLKKSKCRMYGVSPTMAPLPEIRIFV